MNFEKIAKNWKIIVWVAVVLIALGLIFFKGISFGIDFSGGTLFLIQLSEPIKDVELANQIQNTIQKRLDWTGLKDARVTTIGNETQGFEFIQAQIAETDPQTVESLKTLILSQGKFEVMLEGKKILEGEDIFRVIGDPQKGYGFAPQGNQFVWILPFTLTEDGAKKFSKEIFHKCTLTGLDPSSGNAFNCSETYFFIDKPKKSVLIIPRTVFEKNKNELFTGIDSEGIPPQTRIEELLLNSGVKEFLVDANLSLQQVQELSEAKKENKYALIHSGVSSSIKEKLKEIGFIVKEVKEIPPQPWIWTATGARNIISLNPDITGNQPFIARVEDSQVNSSLVIRGFSATAESSRKELEGLRVVLETGSLPIGVEDISKESISPTFGKESLSSAIFIGALAILVVALVLFIRYRILKLAIPIILTGISEVIMILGFASLINWNLDLGSVAGILAVVGTGVDHQILITDELLRGGEIAGEYTLIERAKKAFFIIIVATVTVIATMLPIILFGVGLGKLVGFAIVTISGAILAVTIARPAFSEIMKTVLKKN